MSQEQEILDYMLSGNKISPLEALNKFGCLRLGARIYDLQKKYKNLVIETKLVTRNNKKFSEYWIDKFPLFLEKRTNKNLQRG
ncbi:MAG: helix-turn-helix domain-containing protein [Bacteroidetes bacterium]|nr:helix-turn-helix domain-containing protein [Bacteroidota bacterium]